MIFVKDKIFELINTMRDIVSTGEILPYSLMAFMIFEAKVPDKDPEGYVKLTPFKMFMGGWTKLRATDRWNVSQVAPWWSAYIYRYNLMNFNRHLVLTHFYSGLAIMLFSLLITGHGAHEADFRTFWDFNYWDNQT